MLLLTVAPSLIEGALLYELGLLKVQTYMWLAYSHTKCSLLAIPLYSSILHTHTTHTVANLKAVNTTTNSTTITWDQPPYNYRVFLHGEATDNIPQSRVIQLVDVTGQTTHIVQGLYSFRNYSIGVYLESDLGQGYNATVTFQTQGRGESAKGDGVCVCVCTCECSVNIQVLQ